MKLAGYSWWVNRLRATLAQVDLVRLDHFRGFEAYWAVPASCPTAQEGQWVKAPGADFLDTLKAELGGLPVIAEDLGIITPEVEALRQEFGLPGMRVLQFAFGGAVESRFLPHNYDRNTIAYTGTHDNDTTAGWFAQLKPEEASFLEGYAPGGSKDPAWALIRLAWGSVADVAIAPLQDVMRLGTEARMNTPGTAEGNWRWRFRSEMLADALLDALAELTHLYERAGAKTAGNSVASGGR
jgi:4-alpha-glucanotransferase